MIHVQRTVPHNPNSLLVCNSLTNLQRHISAGHRFTWEGTSHTGSTSVQIRSNTPELVPAHQSLTQRPRGSYGPTDRQTVAQTTAQPPGVLQVDSRSHAHTRSRPRPLLSNSIPAQTHPNQ